MKAKVNLKNQKNEAQENQLQVSKMGSTVLSANINTSICCK
jgi:hypothetical protein